MSELGCELAALTAKNGSVGWVHYRSVVMAVVAVPFVVALLRRVWRQPVLAALAGTPCMWAPGGRHA